jgi:hypothetical protein
MGTFMTKFSKASARFTKAGESNLHNNGPVDPNKKKILAVEKKLDKIDTKAAGKKDDFKYASDVDNVVVGRPTKKGGETAFTGYAYGGKQKTIGSSATSSQKAYSSKGETITGKVVANTKKTPGDIKTGDQYNVVKGYVTRNETPKEKADREKEMKRLNAKG